VLEALGRTGLEGNTLVIFTSDNGGERYSFNWPFSSDKGSLWEGGVRVPAIVRWPGVIPAGRSTEQAAITMDWTATLLGVADTPPDAAFSLDGENLMSVCTGSRDPYDRTLFWRTSTDEAARHGRWKYLKDSETERLFDLSLDAGEKTDLTTKHANVFDEIRKRYVAWNATMLPRTPV
jgi:arylsulfatase A-like enzyme